MESVWRNGFCRKLALILWGETVWTYRESINELTELSRKSGQLLIDAMYITVSQLQTDPNSSINIEELKRLHSLAIKDHATALSRLTNMEEYDSELKIKEEYVNYMLTIQALLNEFGNWIEVISNGGSFDDTRTINDKLYEKALLMKQQQNELVKMEDVIVKKYGQIPACNNSPKKY